MIARVGRPERRTESRVDLAVVVGRTERDGASQQPPSAAAGGQNAPVRRAVTLDRRRIGNLRGVSRRANVRSNIVRILDPDRIAGAGRVAGAGCVVDAGRIAAAVGATTTRASGVGADDSIDGVGGRAARLTPERPKRCGRDSYDPESTLCCAHRHRLGCGFSENNALVARAIQAELRFAYMDILVEERASRTPGGRRRRAGRATRDELYDNVPIYGNGLPGRAPDSGADLPLPRSRVRIERIVPPSRMVRSG